jgi:hypothetical protein
MFAYAENVEADLVGEFDLFQQMLHAVDRTAVNFILSGATALGIGTELIPTEAIKQRQSGRIQELALRFTGFVKEGRERIEKARKQNAAAQKYTETEKCESR